MQDSQSTHPLELCAVLHHLRHGANPRLSFPPHVRRWRPRARRAPPRAACAVRGRSARLGGDGLEPQEVQEGGDERDTKGRNLRLAIRSEDLERREDGAL